MPVELIGEFGTSGADRRRIAAECELAIKHLKTVCGEPPPEMELGIQWQDYELGSYPTIVLTWEDATRGAPSGYIARCGAALTADENGGELPHRWPNLCVVPEDDGGFDEACSNSETPQDPPFVQSGRTTIARGTYIHHPFAV